VNVDVDVHTARRKVARSFFFAPIDIVFADRRSRLVRDVRAAISASAVSVASSRQKRNNREHSLNDKLRASRPTFTDTGFLSISVFLFHHFFFSCRLRASVHDVVFGQFERV